LNEVEQQKRQIVTSIDEATTKAERNIKEAANRMRELKADLREALENASFKDKRFIIQRLNVEATLFTQGDELWLEARCYLGEKSGNCSISEEN
jgi:hypothetical protein